MRTRQPKNCPAFLAVIFISLSFALPSSAAGDGASLFLPAGYTLMTSGTQEVPLGGGTYTASAALAPESPDVSEILSAFEDEVSGLGATFSWSIGRRVLSMTFTFPAAWAEERLITVTSPSSGLFQPSLMLVVAQPADPALQAGPVEEIPSVPWIESRVFIGDGVYTSDMVYYNGLGLPSQNVSVSASGRGRSIVTPVTYDSCMRGDARTWLPFEAIGASALPVRGEDLAARYEECYGSAEAPYVFSENIFDSFSLNRMTSSRKPGLAHHSADARAYVEHGISSVSDQVLCLRYNPSDRSVSVEDPVYVTGLQKTVTTDEDGRMSAEFTDMAGRLVLKRIYSRDVDGVYSPYADTYTVYDAAGRVVWVVSPEGSALLTPSATFPEDGEVSRKWSTVYRYDSRGRMAGRRLPGCGWDEYVYDRGGRLVLERDPVLGSQNRWTYHVYDNMDREVERTIVGSTSSRESIQSAYDTSSAPNLYPYPSHSGNVGIDYRKPAPSIGEFVLVQHLYSARYGNYRYRTGTSTTSTSLFSVPSYLAFAAEPGVVSWSDRSSDVSCLKIYEKLWQTCGGDTPAGIMGVQVERSFHYDSKGRLIQTVEKNQGGGTSRTSVRYDYCGRPLSVMERHTLSSSPGSDVHTKSTAYTYDDRGRVLSETVAVDDLPEATVSYAYDGLGRLSTVTYGNGVSEERSYTVQGWLKEIEAGTASGDAVFRETLRYWENGSTSSLYSGMVSGTSTQNGGPSPLDYDYVYDYLWRILRAGPPASDSWGEKGISYDRNGNLRSLTRYGGDGSVTDMLNMSYIGNVLAGVTLNGVTKLYSHDVGGRLTEDGRTGVSVSYDVTGMPLRTRASAQTSPGTETVHSYLSDGTRLGVSMTLGTSHLQVRSGYENYGSLTFREIGGQQSFESSLFGGGVILSDGVRYYTRDHLGNTRVVTNGIGNVVERDDYYPFGERHEDSSMPTTATNRWRFAGKEIQPLGSTGWIDFGARQYDSFLGRWTTVDPLAEKYPGISPYLYCAGNPVNFVDPNGEETYVYDNQNGKYSVAGGKLNGNRNIYVVDSNNEFVRNERGRRISIGKSMTPVSFYNFKTKSWGNETIDLKNTKGQDFINELTTSMIPLGDYMERAKEYQVYDFKHTDGSEDERREDVLRGMPITQGGATYIASARDIGNYVAGYYAGANGFGWMASRIAFDSYQGGIEGIQTQMAQFLGWKTGSDRIAIVKHYNLLKSAPSLFIFCKKWFQR